MLVFCQTIAESHWERYEYQFLKYNSYRLKMINLKIIVKWASLISRLMNSWMETLMLILEGDDTISPSIFLISTGASSGL